MGAARPSPSGPDPALSSPGAAHAGLRYVDFPPGVRPDAVRPGFSAARAVPGVVRVQLQIPPDATVRRPATGGRHHAYVLATAPTAGSLTRVLDRAAALLGRGAPERRSRQPETGFA